MTDRRRHIVLLALTAALFGDALAQEPRGPLASGAYSFSDELGGFVIRSVSGTGTLSDPFVLVQDFLSATPVTLVIRATKPIRPHSGGGDFATGFLWMRILAGNASGLAWTEFEFELQEQIGIPSTYGDGLSFDQRKTDLSNISSGTFLSYSRDFEPFDRLLFREGKVDPGETGEFGFLISDFTPNRQFFLVQDPRIPSS